MKNKYLDFYINYLICTKLDYLARYDLTIDNIIDFCTYKMSIAKKLTLVDVKSKDIFVYKLVKEMEKLIGEDFSIDDINSFIGEIKKDALDYPEHSDIEKRLIISYINSY